jgi:hypothetical protein
MRSFSAYPRLLLAGVIAALVLVARAAGAQSEAQGFAVERLYLSAPGAGWFVMDDLSMHGGLGGAIAVTTGYARKPLQVGSGAERLSVVSGHLFTDFGFAATFDRFRLYLNLDAPISTKGRSGAVNGYQFTAPSLALSNSPDSFEDARIAADVRVLGEAHTPFRLGFGAQLLFPTGKRSDYDSDGTYRAMVRALVAGDVGALSYAGQLGAHIRPLDESPTTGSPRGSELLFGAGGGVRFPLDSSSAKVIVAGPELYGETAFDSFLGSRSTGLEGLLTGRLEAISDRGALLRFKLGVGGGLDPHFGAPAWRAVCAVELSDEFTHQDGR